MVAFLTVLQGGFTKYYCYFCLWDSSDTVVHYLKRDWPQLTKFSVGKNSFKLEPLLDQRKVMFPPIFLKLDLMKQFVTALNKESPVFKHLQDFFPNLSAVKVEATVFIGHKYKGLGVQGVSPKNSQGRREQHETALLQWFLAS